MNSKDSNLFVRLARKVVGLPTGEQSCCEPSSDCCGPDSAQSKTKNQACCAPDCCDRTSVKEGR